MQQPRYPHEENGQTQAAYSHCGKYVLTVGPNMTLRRFLVGDASEEPQFVDMPADGFDVAVSPKTAHAPAYIAVSDIEGTARLYDLETLDEKRVLTRSSLPLRNVRFSGDGEWCAVSGDNLCMIVNVADVTKTRRVPVNQPVKHVEFHPTNSTIVSVSSLDDVVRVFDLNIDEPISELEMLVPAIKEFGDIRTTAAVWSPQGEVFVVPTKTFELAVVSSRNWLEMMHIKGHANAITAVKWSPNGRYLASCSRDNRLFVFDTAKSVIVAQHDVTNPCGVAWHPHNNELSVTTTNGQLYTVPDIVPQDLPAPFGESFNLLEVLNQRIPAAAAKPDLLRDDNLFVDDDDNGEYTEHYRRRSRNYDEDLFVQGNTSVQKKRQRFASTPSLASQISIKPFQSGSTPLLDQRRYLCMNPVGTVWAVQQPSHHSITINFFDHSSRREVLFQDADMFDMASLGEHACFFASSTTGALAVRFHSSLTDNWTADVDLETDLGISCIALSAEVVVVFTRAGYMRTWTVYGTPLGVVRASPRVIACSAHGNEVISLAHTDGGEFTYTYEDVASQRVYQSYAMLPLALRAKPTAVLFSENGEPCVMDSTETLSTLINGRDQGQARWVPVLGKSKEEKRYWPIGVADSKLLCVVLRGQRQYPAIPLPVTDEVDLMAPGLPRDSAQYIVARSQFQQMQSQLNFVMAAQPDANVQDAREVLEGHVIELDKMLLRQFQVACDQQRVNRARQIVQIIQGQESLHAASQVAGAYGLSALAELIQNALE